MTMYPQNKYFTGFFLGGLFVCLKKKLLKYHIISLETCKELCSPALLNVCFFKGLYAKPNKKIWI